MVALATNPACPSPTLSGRILRLRGLPFNSNAHDVLEFLDPVVPVGGGGAAVFPCTADGRPTGEVFIEVATQADSDAALAKNNQLLGSRYIEVFSASKGELYLTAHQRGFFVFVDGCRVHHAPLPLGATAAAAAAAAETALKTLQVQGSEPRRPASAPGGLDAVGGLSLSQHREARSQGGGQSPYSTSSGTYGLPVGGAGSPWVSLSLPTPAPGFNPAPGPAGSRQGGAGQRQGGSGQRQTLHLTGGAGGSGAAGPPPGFDGYGGQSVVMTPFMLQHPFMGPQTATWGAPAGFLAAQQQAAAAGAAWYAGNQRAMQQAYNPVGYGATPGYYYGQQQGQQGQQGGYYPAPRGGGQHPRGRGRTASPHGHRQHRSSSSGSGGRGNPRPADLGQPQAEQAAPADAEAAAAESSP